MNICMSVLNAFELEYVTKVDVVRVCALANNYVAVNDTLFLQREHIYINYRF